MVESSVSEKNPGQKKTNAKVTKAVNGCKVTSNSGNTASPSLNSGVSNNQGSTGNSGIAGFFQNLYQQITQIPLIQRIFS